MCSQADDPSQHVSDDSLTDECEHRRATPCVFRDDGPDAPMWCKTHLSPLAASATEEPCYECDAGAETEHPHGSAQGGRIVAASATDEPLTTERVRYALHHAFPDLRDADCDEMYWTNEEAAAFLHALGPAASATDEHSHDFPGGRVNRCTCDNPPALAASATEEGPGHIYYCRTCGKTRFVEWLHRECPPDAPEPTDD